MIGLLAAQAALLLAFAATAVVAGTLALRVSGRAGAATAHRAGDLAGAGGLALAGALGLVVLGAIGGLLGLAGRLDRLSLLAVVVVVHVAGAGVWRDAVDGFRRARGGGAAAALPGPGARPPSPRVAPLAVLAFLVPLFVLALYPPVAFDETLYHLPFARAFAATGGLPFLPDLRFPIFPQLGEVLAAMLLLAGGDVATHLPQLLAVALVAGMLFAWGTEVGGTRAAGWIAAAAWLGNPLVVYLAGTGYVDPPLALFAGAACWMLDRWRRGAGGRWAALAGIFAGAAAATKYTGLYFVAALGLAILLFPSQAGRRGRARWRGGLLFAAAALLVMAPWYGRLVALTGNPLFPYLSGVFGDNEWTPVRMRDLALPEPAGVVDAVAAGAARIATLPWDAVARRHRVGNVPPLSPVWLLAVAWLPIAALRDRRLRSPLALTAGFVAIFPLLPPDTRYIVAVLPLASLALGVSLAPWVRRLPASRAHAAAAALALLLALPGALYAGYRLALQGPPPTTTSAREAWLTRFLPIYPAVARANALLPASGTVYGYRAERMRAHVRGRYLSDWYGPNGYARLAATFREPRLLRERLRGWGVDLLLVADPAPELPPALAARAGLELVHEDRAARLYAVSGRPLAATAPARH